MRLKITSSLWLQLYEKWKQLRPYVRSLHNHTHNYTHYSRRLLEFNFLQTTKKFKHINKTIVKCQQKLDLSQIENTSWYTPNIALLRQNYPQYIQQGKITLKYRTFWDMLIEEQFKEIEQLKKFLGDIDLKIVNQSSILCKRRTNTDNTSSINMPNNYRKPQQVFLDKKIQSLIVPMTAGMQDLLVLFLQAEQQCQQTQSQQNHQPQTSQQCRSFQQQDGPSQSQGQKWSYSPWSSQDQSKEKILQKQQKPVVRQIIEIQSESQMQQSSLTLNDYARCVGVIRCAWYNRYGMLELVSFSTAFAISPWMIVTCTHSIFDKKRDRQCDKIQFISFTGAHRYSKKQDVYESRDEDFLRFQKLQKQQNDGNKILRKDFAVFILNRPFNNNCYFELSSKRVKKNQELQIIGYTCKDLTLSTQAIGTFFQRMDLRGHLNRVKEGYILEHNMDTQGGHSGSPILRVQNRNGYQSIIVVGIHTHKGQGIFNQGIRMSSNLINIIQSFCQELGLVHKIPYPIQKKDYLSSNFSQSQVL